jgi:hypothetical protein
MAVTSDLALLDQFTPASKELLQAYPGITNLHSNTVLPEETGFLTAIIFVAYD